MPIAVRHPLLVLVLLAVAGAAAGGDQAPFPGPASDYRGFAKHEFVADGQHLLVVEPKAAAPGRPWIWRCEFFDHEPQGDLALLAQGWHVVHAFLTTPPAVTV